MITHPHLTLRFRLGSVIPLLLLFCAFTAGYRENFTDFFKKHEGS